jgi:hypothetical protein
MSTLGERLSAVRQRRGLTQGEVVRIMPTCLSRRLAGLNVATGSMCAQTC